MIAQSEVANRYLTMAKTFFGTSHPLFNAFGIEIDEVGKGRAVMRMPCSVALSDRHGGLHRGVVVTLLDTSCGLAIFSRLGDMRPIATIDLRVDFIREALPGADVRAEVECYAMQGDIAYVRGKAVVCQDDALLASVSGSFAVGTLGPAFDTTATKGTE